MPLPDNYLLLHQSQPIPDEFKNSHCVYIELDEDHLYVSVSEQFPEIDISQRIYIDRDQKIILLVTFSGNDVYPSGIIFPYVDNTGSKDRAINIIEDVFPEFDIGNVVFSQES